MKPASVAVELYERAMTDLRGERGRHAATLSRAVDADARLETVAGFVTEERVLAANRLMHGDYPADLQFEELVLAQSRDAQLVAGALVQVHFALQGRKG